MGRKWESEKRKRVHGGGRGRRREHEGKGGKEKDKTRRERGEREEDSRSSSFARQLLARSSLDSLFPPVPRLSFGLVPPSYPSPSYFGNPLGWVRLGAVVIHARGMMDAPDAHAASRRPARRRILLTVTNEHARAKADFAKPSSARRDDYFFPSFLFLLAGYRE